jgi:hypothetical protein
MWKNNILVNRHVRNSDILQASTILILISFELFLSSLFGHPSSLAGNLNSPSSLQDEMAIYHQRRLETIETQKVELNREVEKGRKLIGRLQSEIDRLKNQIKAYQNATAMANAGTISFETFYLRDLVSSTSL